MPGRDGTGPRGEGAFTGRGAGFCAGYVTPAIANRVAYGRGGGPYGFGARLQTGRGRRNRFFAGGPGWTPAPRPADELTRNDEIELLRAESQRMHTTLEAIEQRLQELETT